MKCKKEEEEEDIKKLYYVQMNQLSIKYIFIPSASTKKASRCVVIEADWHNRGENVYVKRQNTFSPSLCFLPFFQDTAVGKM